MSSVSLFWLSLAFKVVLTAGIVVSASIAVERSGHFIGALIASLPIASAAAYIILAFEHDTRFLAASAVGSLAASAGTCLFGFTYATLAQRRGLAVSFAASLAVWLVFTVALRGIEWTPARAVALNVAVFAFTIPATLRFRAAVGTRPKLPARRYDLAWRSAIVALFVVVVTSLTAQLGPFYSGIFAVFPIGMGSFAFILHSRLGGPAAARVLAHMQVPLIGFALGFLVLHLTAEALGAWAALAADLATCIAWNTLLWAWERRRQRP